MATVLRPNSMIVIPEWIRTIPELVSNGTGSGTELPGDNTTWGASGFVVTKVVGGTRDTELNAGRPVLEVAVWAGVANKSRPMWGTANNIYQSVVAAHQNEATLRRLLTLTVRGKNYGTARLLECYPLGEEQKRYDQAGDYACIWANWQFHWVGA